MQIERLETKVHETLIRFGRVPAVPAIQRDPVPEFRTSMVPVDHETGHADKPAGLVLDNRKGCSAAVLPGRCVGENPLGRHPVGIGMRNGESRVCDLTHAREALDIERVVG